MIQSNEDLEGYLLRLERRFEAGGGWNLSAQHGRGSAARRAARRGAGARGPGRHRASSGRRRRPEAPCCFRKLLVLNATALVHATYGIEGDKIVAQRRARAEKSERDLNELEAVLADLDMALANQVPTLREISKKASA